MTSAEQAAADAAAAANSAQAEVQAAVAEAHAAAASAKSGANVIIRDSDGDDEVIISGDHPNDSIDIDLGPGKDRIIRTEKDPAGPMVPGAIDHVGPSGLTIVAVVLILAALAGFALWRFGPSRNRS